MLDTPDMKVVHVEAGSKRFDVLGGTTYFPDGTVDEELSLVPAGVQCFLMMRLRLSRRLVFLLVMMVGLSGLQVILLMLVMVLL